MDVLMALKVAALVTAKRSGVAASHVVFSDKLEWVGGHDGRVRLRSAALDHGSQRVTLYLGAMQARWDASDLQPKALAVLADALASLKEFNEDDHPRDEDGKFTFSGSDGGGSSDADSGASIDVVDDTIPTGGKGEKVKLSDFAKDKIDLGGLRDKDKADRFVDSWSRLVGDAPAAFKHDFLGGVDSTMKIDVVSANNWTIAGSILDDDGQSVGTYRRLINLDDKTAESDFFQLNRGTTKQDIGKKVLAGNMATYQRLGIERVKVHANIDVGGYAWAKYGYVPTRLEWGSLSFGLLSKLDRESGRGGSGFGSGSGYTPASWEEVDSDEQDSIKEQWKASTRNSYLESEIESWRENGEALHQAKTNLASMYDAGTGDFPEWALDAVAAFREQHNGVVPYTDAQILGAVTVTYDDDNYNGRADPEITFDDSKLQSPSNFDPNQGLLPGIEPIDASQQLTDKMRDSVSAELVTAFNEKAESDAIDVEPPDYLADQVDEYQDQSWDDMSDGDKYRYASRNGLISEIPNENDEEPAPVDLGDDASNALRKLLTSSDPKAIWAVADSPKGKQLLLGSDWYGVINLKDKETMDRFNAYVGKIKVPKYAKAA